MPFTYETPVNPYTPTIAELLLRRGDIAAAGARASGQAWSQAAQQIGQAASSAITTATDPRRQMEQIALTKAKQEQTEQANLRDLQTPKVPNGPQPEGAGPAAAQNPYLKQEGDVSVWDVDGLDRAMAARGTPLSPTSLKAITDLNAAHREEMSARTAFGQAQTNLVAKAAGTWLSIKRAHPEADDASLGKLIGDQLAANGTFQPGQVQQTIQGLLSDPTQLVPKLELLSKQGSQAPVLLKDKELALNPNDISGPPLATNVVPEKPNEAEIALKAAGGDPAKAMDLLKPKQVESAQSVDKLLDGKPTTLMFDPKTKQYTDASGKVIENAASRIKPIPSAASVAITAGALSDPALEQAATQYLQTGKLPPGMGAAAVARNAKIMNRAAEIDPKAALALNQATFKADSANLTNLQKTEGTLSAFENTAGKNLDQFLTLADKIPDTGVPWLNTPVRMLDAKIVGSANMAAINAARDVALREIARVTNDPKMSGALTDSARHEIQSLVPANATLPQIKAVVKVLKQDMANVHAGLTQQIESVKSGLAGHPGATAAPAAPDLYQQYLDRNKK